MPLQSKVLHLSLLVAMVLPPVALASDSSEDSLTSVDSGNHAGEQVAAGTGEAHKYRNSGESSRLRHRVNEAEKDEAERHRLEKHEDEPGTGTSSDQEQSGDQDRVKDQDRVRDQTRVEDQDNLMDQNQAQDRDRIRDPDREMDANHTSTMTSPRNQDAEPNRTLDPYAFEDRPARQRFSTDGSMYRGMSSGSAKGGSSSSTGSRSAGGARHGGGGR